MFTLDDISKGFASVAGAYPLTRAFVFGSQARGEARFDSDIDIVLDPSDGFSLFDLCGLRNDLCDRFDVPVDVVTRSGMKERVLDSAQQDEVLIYERT